MRPATLVRRLEDAVFGRRWAVLVLFGLASVLMAWSASGLRVSAGFAKLLPTGHEYMRTFREYREEFGGANRVLIALVAEQGDMFTPRFFAALETVTDEVFFLPGVDRTQVYSIFTPNVRFTEVVEDGIAGGNVVPADFAPTPAGLEQVRENVLKAGIVGRLVANDFTGALVSAQLLDVNPNTGEKLDYVRVARELERLRAELEDEWPGIEVHVIGFAKIVGDIAEGAARVVLFFGIAFAVTALFVLVYSQSIVLTAIPLGCSLVAVIWQLGLLRLAGFGIDPMSILVPFLVFAIGVSHGVQMVSAVRAEIFFGRSAEEAARRSFRRLLVPGSAALASDTAGFITILLIDIPIIQETAITASLGVAAIILTNLVLLPVVLSYSRFDDAFRQRISRRAEYLHAPWRAVARVSRPRPALVVIALALALLAFGAWKAPQIRIGDLHRGVPELRPDARYNVDSRIISERFSIGVDLLGVIAETVPNACIDYDIMTAIDRFAWHMRNVPGVQSVVALPSVAKVINAGWNEGSLEWRVLPRNRHMLVQAISPVPTTSGLLNTDCSAMQVQVFTTDHKAETIARLVSEAKRYRREHPADELRLRLATGNVGVMAATNEEVKASQFPILLYVFSAVVALCLVTFRSVRATLCIVLPLGLVSLLAYALMTMLEIGLKVSTLPVVALGVGIGVDYGIYVYSRLESILATGQPLDLAYENTLRITGSGVVFTGLTLAAGVATWIFAPLKFQADMGILLTFMFLVNMLGAIVLLPALARWLLPATARDGGS